jgi:hypothetical protein
VIRTMRRASGSTTSRAVNSNRRLIKDTKKVTKADREIALSEVADLSILREAQKELGIKVK